MYMYNLPLDENVLYVQVEPYLTNVTNEVFFYWFPFLNKCKVTKLQSNFHVSLIRLRNSNLSCLNVTSLKFQSCNEQLSPLRVHSMLK